MNNPDEYLQDAQFALADMLEELRLAELNKYYEEKLKGTDSNAQHEGN